MGVSNNVGGPGGAIFEPQTALGVVHMLCSLSPLEEIWQHPPKRRRLLHAAGRDGARYLECGGIAWEDCNAMHAPKRWRRRTGGGGGGGGVKGGQGQPETRLRHAIGRSPIANFPTVRRSCLLVAARLFLRAPCRSVALSLCRSAALPLVISAVSSACFSALCIVPSDLHST